MILYMVGTLTPNSTHFTRGLVKYVPGRGYFRAVPCPNGDKFATSPTPPQSLNAPTPLPPFVVFTWHKFVEQFKVLPFLGCCCFLYNLKSSTVIYLGTNFKLYSRFVWAFVLFFFLGEAGGGVLACLSVEPVAYFKRYFLHFCACVKQTTSGCGNRPSCHVIDPCYSKKRNIRTLRNVGFCFGVPAWRICKSIQFNG